MVLPTGSSQAEDFETEQLSAYTQSREMTLQQEELFNLSQVKNNIQDEACVCVVSVSSCSSFFSFSQGLWHHWHWFDEFVDNTL